MKPQPLSYSDISPPLLYRPALWFLYASLISAYLVVRFVLSNDRWPTQADLHLEMLSPWIGTAALLISTFTIGKSTGGSRLWLLLTLLLGIGFACFQFNEFRRRWEHNLIPTPLSNSLHDRADLYYLSAVQQRLVQLATEISADKVRQNQLIERIRNSSENSVNERVRLEAELAKLQAEESQRTARIAVINQLLTNEARWTSTLVATIDDGKTQRMAIATLAYDIHPYRAFIAAHQKFRELESQRYRELLISCNEELRAAEETAKKNSQPIKGLLEAVAGVKAELQELESQLKAHLRQRVIDEDREELPEQEDDLKRAALESQFAEVKTRLDEKNATLSAAAQLVTDAEDSASRLSQELSSLEARQATIDEIDSAKVGLNERYPWMRLPVCIPGGTAWAWTYFTLMITHSIHLVYALLAVLWLIVASSSLSGDRLSIVERLIGNWRCLVVVWTVLFALIYLI